MNRFVLDVPPHIALASAFRQGTASAVPKKMPFVPYLLRGSFAQAFVRPEHDTVCIGWRVVSQLKNSHSQEQLDHCHSERSEESASYAHTAKLTREENARSRAPVVRARL